MPDHFLERRIRIRPRWALYFLLLLVAVCVTAYSVHNNRIIVLSEEKAVRELAVAEANNRVKMLKDEFALRGDETYIAKVAREKYGYMMEGETRYMFEGLQAPEYVAPSIPVSFAPMETQPPQTEPPNPS